MNHSSRLKNILNRRNNLWNDSETDTSSISDNDNIKKEISSHNSETSSNENSESSMSTCCLICSILPNLSNINTCEKHLALLTKSITPTPIVYMMHPAISNYPKLHCHCRSKSKHRCRSSSSSSSSSSKPRHYRKKRSMIVQSSDTSSQDDLFFSPNVQSQEITNDNQQHRFNHVQNRLSPSLPPSSTIHTNINKQYNELLFTSFLQNNNNNIESILNNTSVQQELSQINYEINSPDIIEIDSDLSCKPIVHVKDDDNEILNDSIQKKVMINMDQITEQMLNYEYPQPIILLKRVCFEK